MCVVVLAVVAVVAVDMASSITFAAFKVSHNDHSIRANANHSSQLDNNDIEGCGV